MKTIATKSPDIAGLWEDRALGGGGQGHRTETVDHGVSVCC